ncbi:MAG: hypothetical protein P8L85_00805 [Rubripirellula sp.]|nr:hypothetical protein [Rubripirellula sp.]
MRVCGRAIRVLRIKARVVAGNRGIPEKRECLSEFWLFSKGGLEQSFQVLLFAMPSSRYAAVKVEHLSQFIADCHTRTTLADENRQADQMTQAPRQNEPWRTLASIPEPLTTERFVLEPLAPRHAVLDFAAFMSCRARLRTELQWGEWPPADFTLELNRADLGEHYEEFVRREAFAYTVLSVDRERCLGCVYLERCVEIGGCQLAYWVIDDAINREAELVDQMLRWVHQQWAIERLLLPFHQTNQRGITLARNRDLVEWDSPANGPLARHLCFLSIAGDLPV